jgi:exodeoxyribonuclease-3
MKVITLNVNGIVNAVERGLLEWFAQQQDVDVVCLQETRVKEYQLPTNLLEIPGFYGFFFDAEKVVALFVLIKTLLLSFLVR